MSRLSKQIDEKWFIREGMSSLPSKDFLYMFIYIYNILTNFFLEITWIQISLFDKVNVYEQKTKNICEQVFQ